MYIRPLSVVRVFLEDQENRILLLKRQNESYGGGKYCLPGGKVDLGNSLNQTAVEELKEETNLEISDLVFLFFQEDLGLEPDGIHCITFYFSAKYQGTIKLNEESSKYIWVKPENHQNIDIAFSSDTKAIQEYLKTN